MIQRYDVHEFIEQSTGRSVPQDVEAENGDYMLAADVEAVLKAKDEEIARQAKIIEEFSQLVMYEKTAKFPYLRLNYSETWEGTEADHPAIWAYLKTRTETEEKKS